MKGEFDFIRYIKKSFGLRAVGDDCAILPKDDRSDLLVTADLLVENIDFRLEWTMPEDLGRKALAVSLSDIAAMGGKPAWALLTIGIPESLWESDFVKRFYEGWTELAEHFEVQLVGGDISRASELVIDSIVGGEVPKGAAVLRSGARAGDAIYVSGSLGSAAAGLQILEKANQFVPDSRHERLIEFQLRPTPRVELGRWLLEYRIPTAMIDLSDGLSSDIHHICELSGVGADLDASLIPIDKDLKNSFSANRALAFALNGGEDFELLFTVPEEKIFLLKNAQVSRIGTVTGNAGVVQLRDGNEIVELQPSGYRHF